MSSNQSENPEPSGGGKGIFIALIPWIVFTVLASHATLKLGSLAALAAAIVIAVPGIRSGRPKVLEVGAIVTFIGFVVVAFLAALELWLVYEVAHIDPTHQDQVAPSATAERR